MPIHQLIQQVFFRWSSHHKRFFFVKRSTPVPLENMNPMYVIARTYLITYTVLKATYPIAFEPGAYLAFVFCASWSGTTWTPTTGLVYAVRRPEEESLQQLSWIRPWRSRTGRRATSMERRGRKWRSAAWGKRLRPLLDSDMWGGLDCYRDLEVCLVDQVIIIVVEQQSHVKDVTVLDTNTGNPGSFIRYSQNIFFTAIIYVLHTNRDADSSPWRLFLWVDLPGVQVAFGAAWGEGQDCPTVTAEGDGDGQGQGWWQDGLKKVF